MNLVDRVKMRIKELMKQREWSRYILSQKSELTELEERQKEVASMQIEVFLNKDKHKQ